MVVWSKGYDFNISTQEISHKTTLNASNYKLLLNLDNRAFNDFQNAENTESMEFSVKQGICQTG